MAGEGVLIVIPARGGSKGLPRKNARRLGDLPLLGWTAEAIRRSGLNGAVSVLSTDDREIAEIGKSVGLEVPFLRPPELATDTATPESVALHALDWLAAKRGFSASALMLLQPTSPFRPPSSLSEAVAMLSDATVKGVLGVKAIHRSLRTLFFADDRKRLSPVDAGISIGTRRQDQKTLYTPNGTLYLVSSDVLRSGQTFFPDGCRALVMDQIASLDIDDPVDWEIAEAIAAAGGTWRGRLAGV
jgi:CMP-N,N'-diacetyllegionaminic acid synthase